MSSSFLCKDCGRQFTTKRSLDRHAATACKKEKSLPQQIDELTTAMRDLTMMLERKFPDNKESPNNYTTNVVLNCAPDDISYDKIKQAVEFALGLKAGARGEGTKAP